MTHQIEIPEQIKILLQKYDIEQESRKNVIAYVLSFNDINISNDRFNTYQKDYEDKLLAFNIAKNELDQKYIKPIMKNKKYTWTLDYSNNIITVIEQDEKTYEK